MGLEPLIRAAKWAIRPLRLWKAGVHRLTAKEIEKLGRIKHKGVLVEVIPLIKDKPDPKSVGFEIWSAQNQIGFHFFAREKKAAEAIKSQLNAVYPGTLFREAEPSFIR